MSLFLSGLPLLVSAILLVVLPTVLACAGLVLVRRRIGLERLITNNEVAGFKFAVVGVIYAVLLAFAIVVVWDRYNDAELAVIHEGGAVVNLYRLAGGAAPDAVQTRAALGNYVRLAIHRDWPQMARARKSPEATDALNALYGAAARFSRSGSRPPGLMAAMFAQLDEVTQARRSREHLAGGVVPSVLWAALILGAILTVGFTFFFGIENLHAQVLMTAVLAIIVFMGLFVIVSIEHPFTGPVHVGYEALQAAMDDFGGG